MPRCACATLVAVRAVFHLTPKEARELRKELVEVVKHLRERHKPSRAKKRKYALTLAMVPTEEDV